MNDLALDKHTLEGLVHNLTEVRQVFLGEINMSSISPNVLMNLSAPIRSLSLFDCGLQGKFPENIFHLPNLKILNLGSNENLTLNLRQSNKSNHLELLDLSETSISKGLLHSIGNLVSLTNLTLNLRQSNKSNHLEGIRSFLNQPNGINSEIIGESIFIIKVS
ncbi:hypothetical protein PTKIN_Ptkin14bG0026800 [Pterospermum kingtungense]